MNIEKAKKTCRISLPFFVKLDNSKSCDEMTRIDQYKKDILCNLRLPNPPWMRYIIAYYLK